MTPLKHCTCADINCIQKKKNGSGHDAFFFFYNSDGQGSVDLHTAALFDPSIHKTVKVIVRFE